MTNRIEPRGIGTTGLPVRDCKKQLRTLVGDVPQAALTAIRHSDLRELTTSQLHLHEGES